MPACRQMSLTGTPASACLRIETIWVSVKRDFFMEPPGWGNMPESSTYGVSAIWGSLRMEVIGYDRTRRKYLSRSYDDQGSSEQFEVALTGKRWRIAGESVRFSGGFSADFYDLTGLWEYRGRKAGWQPWIRLRLVRAR